MSEKKDAKKKIEELTKEIQHHADLYYKKDAPEISDSTYDLLYQELLQLEKKYPEFTNPNSPTSRVGGKLLDGFKKVAHRFQQWSYDNAFDYADVITWEKRILTLLEKKYHSTTQPSYVAELKIDGLKIILSYQNGNFIQGTTRGDGKVGEDITESLKMLKSIPLFVAEKRSFTVIGEAWISRSDFERINREQENESKSQYANPRNLAAGTLRQLDTKVISERNVQCFMYDFESEDFSFQTHEEELAFLVEQGFVVNSESLVTHELSDIQKWYESWVIHRGNQEYGIDGIVIKVNQKEYCNTLGYTAKAPRFGIAYKFPSVEKTTTVSNIILQIGRTGILTPVALLDPIEIDGSVVGRATLHNESEIQRLQIGIGDTVIVEKSGDIIPKIKKVIHALRPQTTKTFSFEEYLEKENISARQELSESGIISWYANKEEIDEVTIQNLIHFCSKKAANIEGLGHELVRSLYQNNVIKERSDFFALQESDFMKLPLFKEKASRNVFLAIQNARTIDFSAFIFSLGILHVGQKTPRIYAQSFSDVHTWRKATYEDLLALHGIGETTAQSTFQFLENPDAQKELTILINEMN